MPFYQKLGLLPRKRHVQFRRPDGVLYSEELFGTEGFVVGSVRYNPRTINEIPALQDETDLQGTFGFQPALLR